MNMKDLTVKKLGAITCLLAAGMFLQSCSDTLVGAGVGAAVGGIIGHEVGRNEHRRDHRDWRRGGHRGYHNVIQTMDTAVVTDQDASIPDEVSVVAQKYNISEDASLIIVDSLYRAQNFDFSGLKDLGLTQKDALAMYNNQFPSGEAVASISQNLNMEMGDAALMIKQMTNDIQAEKARLNLQ